MSSKPPLGQPRGAYAHPLFLDQLEAMIAAVEKARQKDPKEYKRSVPRKRLPVRDAELLRGRD